MPAIHFISGLPRSGSTLLAALLRQNPRLQAGMSGPLAGLFGALLSEMSARNEYSIFIDDAKRQRILHGLFDNYYADCPAEVIFDNVRVPARNLIGELGAGYSQAMKILEGGRVGIAGFAAGIARGAMEEARAYALERKQFGKPVADGAVTVQLESEDLGPRVLRSLSLKTDAEGSAAFELRTAFPGSPRAALPAEDAFLLPEVRSALRSLWN